VPNSVPFAASVAELAHGKKSRTQSLTQSSSLFDALETHTDVVVNKTWTKWEALTTPNVAITNIIQSSKYIK